MNNETSKRTAISRSTASAPLRWLHSKGYITPVFRVYDHGCGKGADVRWLNDIGIRAVGWDPNHAPDGTGPGTADAWANPGGVPIFHVSANRGLCTYVLNTLPREQCEAVLNEALDSMVDGSTLFVSVRRDVPADSTTQRNVCLIDELADTDLVVSRLVNKKGAFAIYAVSRY